MAQIVIPAVSRPTAGDRLTIPVPSGTAPRTVSNSAMAGQRINSKLGVPLVTEARPRYGAFHSRSTILGGSAVSEGAKALLYKIRVAAAARLSGSANEIELVDGRARMSDGRSFSFAELAADHLRVDAAFANNNKLTYAYGSTAAHVAVDPGTGRVELLDYLVVEDVGRIVNPLTLHGQAIGGVVQGLDGAFMENLVYDANGQLLTGNLADYLIPMATDFPRIRTIALEHYPSPSNPLGVKGAGAGAIIPVGGLMANAVANALASFGAMPNELPLSTARVWLMGSNKKSVGIP